MTKKMERMSFTVPPEFKEDLSYVADRLGISRSAVVHQILGGALREVCTVLEDIPAFESPFPASSETAKRFKNGSIAYINEASATINRMFDSVETGGSNDGNS